MPDETDTQKFRRTMMEKLSEGWTDAKASAGRNKGKLAAGGVGSAGLAGFLLWFVQHEMARVDKLEEWNRTQTTNTLVLAMQFQAMNDALEAVRASIGALEARAAESRQKFWQTNRIFRDDIAELQRRTKALEHRPQ